MKAYTYLIKHKPTGKTYYGSRFKNIKLKIPAEEDLWKEYFTSSKKIEQLIEDTGVDSFEVEIRKIFSTPEKATAWEAKVLRRMKVLENQDQWINGNIAGYIIPTEESRQKISEFHKDKPKSNEHKKKLSESQKGSKRAWAIKNLPTNCVGKNNGRYGKPVSQETRRKIGEANRGKTPANKGVAMSEEQKAKISAARRANPVKLSPEVIAARAEKQRGQKREKRYCLHCDRDIAVGWYNRHGDNCKNKPF